LINLPGRKMLSLVKKDFESKIPTGNCR